MLPQNRRLSRINFLAVNKNGKILKRDFFWIKILPNSLGFNRFAIVTSTKLSKSAVIRNKLRRDIYRAVEKLLGSFDVVIFPQKTMLNLENEKISSEINSSLSEISH